jgi:hypothetical protein
MMTTAVKYYTLHLPLLFSVQEEFEAEPGEGIDGRRLTGVGLAIAQRFYDSGCIVDDLVRRGWQVQLLEDLDELRLIRRANRDDVEQDVTEVLERHDSLLVSAGDYPEPQNNDLLWETREGHLIPHRHEFGGPQLSVGDEYRD